MIKRLLQKIMLHPLHPLQLVFGLLVWSGWFVFVYGGTGVICEVAPPPVEDDMKTWVNAGVLALGTLVGGFLLFNAWRCWKATPGYQQGKPDKRFLGRVAGGVYLVAAIASFGLVLPALFLPPCV